MFRVRFTTKIGYKRLALAALEAVAPELTPYLLKVGDPGQGFTPQGPTLRCWCRFRFPFGAFNCCVHFTEDGRVVVPAGLARDRPSTGNGARTSLWPWKYLIDYVTGYLTGEEAQPPASDASRPAAAHSSRNRPRT